MSKLLLNTQPKTQYTTSYDQARIARVASHTQKVRSSNPYHGLHLLAKAA